MIGALAWLTGSQTGRTIAAIALGALAVAAILWRAFSAGQSAEKAKQAQAAIDALRDRIKTDDEIQKMGVDARRRQFRRWLSNDSA